MKKLGISVYLDQPVKENLQYIELAATNGFTRIFTCLLSVSEGKRKQTLNELKQIAEFANSLNMQLIADVAPDMFKKLGADYNNLYVFKEMGLYGIRLDLGYGGLEESIMSCNPYGLKIELNISGGTKYIENILAFRPNTQNLLACHNFYPHIYTGLSYKHFWDCSRQTKALGIRTAAFVNSPSAGGGPWPVSEGLCTLEMHRGLPLQVQVKHLLATGVIDDVIIANAFATKEELQTVGCINKDILELSVEAAPGNSELTSKVMFEEQHFNRGDVSDYMIRSTQSRIKYKDIDFPIFNPAEIERGDVLIESSLYPRYAGELQIALRPMKNSGRTNVAGKISSEEIFLLDFIAPWSKFKLVSC